MEPPEYDALFEAEESHWWFDAVRRDVADAVSRFRRASPGGRWLDAGCGTGGLLAFYPGERAGARMGVDSSFEALRSATRRRAGGLARASVQALPFPDAAFELITSVDVLCHRGADPRQGLEEMARCLSPGGLLVLQVPAFGRLHSEHDRAVWSVRRFSRREVRDLVEAAGLRVLDCSFRNVLLFPAVAAHRLITRRPLARAPRSDVRRPRALVNRVLAWARRGERPLQAGGLSLPFGLSVFCAAEKRTGPAR